MKITKLLCAFYITLCLLSCAKQQKPDIEEVQDVIEDSIAKDSVPNIDMWYMSEEGIREMMRGSEQFTQPLQLH